MEGQTRIKGCLVQEHIQTGERGIGWLAVSRMEIASATGGWGNAMGYHSVYRYVDTQCYRL